MNKTIRKVICTLIVVAIVIPSCLAVLFACNENEGDGTKKYDSDSRPLTLSISALDGTFNPFFTTSATDSTIANFTQVAMLSTSNEGEVECGENVPTVALDYSITSYDKNNNVVSGGNVDHTTYEFVIKNGMKFSDGEPLTIADVLFNLYVYLDPMYSGSSTIYSVDIQGLQAYRNNDATLGDDASGSDNDQSYRNQAQGRINQLIKWADDEIADEDLTEQMLSDIEAVKEQLDKDLRSEWTANAGTLAESYKEYSFTEDWESFYLIEGIIGVKTKLNENQKYVAIKDSNDKYVTDLNIQVGDEYVVDVNHESSYASHIYEQCSDEVLIAQYMRDNACSRDEAIELIKKETAIQYVYDSYASDDSIKGSIKDILESMSTGSNILDQWALEAKEKDLATKTDNVKHISGITTKKVTSFNGVNGIDLKGKEYDVLSITINGIDPKAIWSFAFAVAPMHYYSDAETINNKTDYPYGVRARDKKFFDEVLNSSAKNALPVGAGAYRASNSTGTASEKPSEVVAKDFWSNKKVYFERNDYFHTLGEGIENAKIRRLTYVEISENNILNNLLTGAIDYGTPSATKDNQEQVEANGSLGSIAYKTSGYGYIGINPKYVKDIEVRRAIMMAFNIESIIDGYYSGTMAEPIYRPMSKLSWAYPTGCTSYYAFDAKGEVIEALVEKAGYKKNKDNIYEKNGETLKFKFTIAGDTTDHPAAQMFEDAKKLLNAHGFDITVGTDVQALRKLATGGLEVWAAAWTSTIDPDMYQIYHKDSKTTNVKNWNYDGILNDSTGQYDREKAIIYDLSDLIDQGRETNNKDQRANIYSQALDKIMELAVEFPTYQRNDLAVYNKDVINVSTLNLRSDLKYSSPIDRIWEIDYN